VAKTNVPNGCATDLEKECKAYDALIEASGGIDLQLLGIGLDGHIGFNEPDTYFEKATHVVDLDPSTIEANARFFASRDEVPTQAMTMGLGSIMKAKKILLIASGEKKAKVLREAFSGKVSPKIPASILQLHPDVTVIISEK
jgi:glucosamine-6-phosphate deaminase